MVITTPKSKRDFAQYFHLRWKILRKPWGEPEGSEQDEHEGSSYHVMVKEGDKVIGVARLQNIAPAVAQVRYMGIDDNYQGKGIGRLMMQHIEAYARDSNIDELFLHARENALGFYTTLGYKQLEKSYLLFNSIQHYKMNKRI
ncbi:MAG: GNAT family N-acetyltransferase [Gammaproteobacteria bacterium]